MPGRENVLCPMDQMDDVIDLAAAVLSKFASCCFLILRKSFEERRKRASKLIAEC
jgi:hypothetical protein